MSPRGDVYCSPPTWEHRECLSGGDHISFSQQGSDSLAKLLYVWTQSHPEEPREGASPLCAHEALLPGCSSAQSTESKPMKTVSVLPSTKLNRVHSTSSAPFISKHSQAHNTLHSLVLCHKTIKGLSLTGPVEMPPPPLCSCQIAVLSRKHLSIPGHLECHTLMRVQEDSTAACKLQRKCGFS